MSGTAAIGEVVALLEDNQRAWVRVAITEPGELRIFEITLGASPPGWTEIDWRYPSARLLSFTETGAVTANWLRDGEIKTRELVIPLTGLGPNAITDRRQSRAERAGHEPLDWPYDEWNVSLNRANSFAGELIPVDDAPSFVSFDRAAANLLGLPRLTPNWMLPSPELIVRRQDTSARISRAFVNETAVDVTVEGEELALSVLELAGDLPGESLTLRTNETQTLRFETPLGLPLGAWLVLRRDGAWLDRRSFPQDPRLPAEAGIEFAPPPHDPDDSAPFTSDEQAQIRQAISTVKMLARAQFALEAEQLARLDLRLDALAETSSRLSRRDWLIIVYGTAMTLVAEHVVTSEIARQIFGLLGRELPRLFGLPLPLLPG